MWYYFSFVVKHIFIIEVPPNDITRFNASAMTATYNETKIGILKRDDVIAPE